MRKHLQTMILVSVLAVGVAPFAAPTAARAQWSQEAWLAGGFNNADYADDIRACFRGGLGAVFEERVSLGANVQVDRDRWYYFGYAGVYLPKFGAFEPYARLHIGRRDDTDETAFGWSAGLRLGESRVFLFLEAHGIRQPGYSDGASLGVSF